MKKISIIILSIVLVVGMALSVNAANEKPFALFIEAEDCALDTDTGCMVANNDKAIGGKAMTCFADVGLSGTAKSDKDGFTLKFTVPADGKYTVWGRVYAPTQTANSLHYSVDGGDSQVWDWMDEAGEAACYGTWHYFFLTYRKATTPDDNSPAGVIETKQLRHEPNVLELTAGEHTIHFTGREPAWLIDQFVITELDIDEYDPNAYTGNNKKIDSCKFCPSTLKHYVEDIYAATGMTAEKYFNETLYGEGAGDTSDAIIVPAVLLGAACVTGIAVSRKKRR